MRHWLVLVLVTGMVSAQPPSDWAPRIAGGQMLYSAEGDGSLPSNCLPSVGNGFLGWAVSCGSFKFIFVSPLFNHDHDLLR